MSTAQLPYKKQIPELTQVNGITSSLPLKELSPTQVERNSRKVSEMRELSPTAVVTGGADLHELSPTDAQRRRSTVKTQGTNSSPTVIYNAHRPRRPQRQAQAVDTEDFERELDPTEVEGMSEDKLPYHESLPDLLEAKKKVYSEEDPYRELGDSAPRNQNTPRPLYALLDDEEEEEEEFYATARPTGDYLAEFSPTKTPKYFFTVDENGGRTYFIESDEDEEMQETEEPLQVQLINNHGRKRISLVELHGNQTEKSGQGKLVPRPLHPLVEEDEDEFYKTVDVPPQLMQASLSSGKSCKVYYTVEDGGQRTYYMEETEVTDDEDEEDEPLDAQLFKKHVKQRASLFKLNYKGTVNTKRQSLRPVESVVEHRGSRYMGEFILSEPNPQHNSIQTNPVETQEGYTQSVKKRYSTKKELTEDMVPRQRGSLFATPSDVTSVTDRTIPRRQSTHVSSASSEQTAMQTETLRRQTELMTGLREEQLPTQRNSIYSRATDVASIADQRVPKRQSTYIQPTEAEQRAAEMEQQRRQSEYIAYPEEEFYTKQRDSIYSRAADAMAVKPHQVPKRHSAYISLMAAEQEAAEMERRRRESEYMPGLIEEQLPAQRNSIYSRATDVASVAGQRVPKRQSTYIQPTEAEQRAAEMEQQRRQSEYIAYPEEEFYTKQRDSIYSRAADAMAVKPHQVPKRHSAYVSSMTAEQEAAEMERRRRESEYMPGLIEEQLPAQRNSIYSRATDVASVAGQRVPKRQSTYIQPTEAEQRAAEMEQQRRQSEYIAYPEEEFYTKQRDSIYSRAADAMAVKPHQVPKRHSAYVSAMTAEQEAAEMERRRRESRYMTEAAKEVLMNEKSDLSAAATGIIPVPGHQVPKRHSAYVSAMTAEQEAAEMEQRRRQSRYMVERGEEVIPSQLNQLRSEETARQGVVESNISHRYSVYPEIPDADPQSMESAQNRRKSEYLGGAAKNESGRKSLHLQSRHGSLMQEADKAAVPMVVTVQSRGIGKRPPLMKLETAQQTAGVDYNRRYSRAMGPVEDENPYDGNAPRVLPYFNDDDVAPTDWDDVVPYRDTQTDDFSQTPQPRPVKKSNKQKKGKGSKYPPLPHSSRGVTGGSKGKKRGASPTPAKNNTGKDPYWSFVSPNQNTVKSNEGRYASSARKPGKNDTYTTNSSHLANTTTQSATPLGRYTDSPYLQNYPRRQITSAPPVRTLGGDYDNVFSHTYSAGAAPSVSPYSSDRISSHYLNGSYRYCDLRTGKMMQHTPGALVDEELEDYNETRFQRLSDRTR